MRTYKISLQGTGVIPACILAAALVLHPEAIAGPVKPVPPPKPATPAPKVPVLRPSAPVPVPRQGTQPGVQPVRPVPGQPVRPVTQPAQPSVQPVRPGGTQPIQPEYNPVRPINQPVRPNAQPNSGFPGRQGGGVAEHRTPAAVVPHDPKGNFNTRGGIQGHVDPKSGRITHFERTNPDGSRTFVHNSPTGVRRVETVVQDPLSHTTVRTVGDGHRGFRERELTRRPGFRQRTYFDNGHTEVRIYHERTYVYGSYPEYVPAYYYHPAFYAYFGVSWGAPVSYNWGAYPGYNNYNGYFAPASSYSSPDAWMADYIIAQNLQATYNAQQDAAADAAASGDPLDPQITAPLPIPEDVRQAYVQEVESTIDAAKALATGLQAADTVPGALNPSFRVFQSYSDVEAIDGKGQECALTGGDFVRREEDVPDSAKTVAVTVVTVAKPTASHCQASTRVRLTVETLQDWYNNFTASQQAGFDAMAAQQGKNGFPAATDVAKVTNPDGVGTADDPNVLGSAIQEQQSSATAIQAQATGGQ